MGNGDARFIQFFASHNYHVADIFSLFPFGKIVAALLSRTLSHLKQLFFSFLGCSCATFLVFFSKDIGNKRIGVFLRIHT
ncbi:hypothetical protein C5U62_02995 [Pseudomonas protegens]|uniref:Uncharacterized protein n=1 Tax=Pseudomonas protegens TaxID=380021 RepID=A0A2T6GS29_9PSED|nr:hypothetical protein C5U62_02995 [Pseudomonas protegens]